MLLSIIFTFAGANLSAKKYRFVGKKKCIFTFVLFTDSFGVAAVVFHKFTPAFIF